MPQVVWDNSLAVGIHLIDEQHKVWIERLNSLSTAIEAHRDAGHISRTLDFMVDYVVYHFETEEGHMAAQGYPGLQRHKTLHAGFRKILSELVQDFEEEGATHQLSDSVNNFQVSWLKNHIRQEDKDFGVFLSNKGVVLRQES